MDTIDKEIIEENFKKWNIPRPTQDYMVVIQCLTYNHEKFIADALKGFVMQKTSFPFCAILIDDASTDNTPNVILRYAEQYPEIIKPILLGENHYQNKKNKLPYFDEWLKSAKYIAKCEGDDYWTDPMKLQKQVDFLEEHEEYVLSFHDARIVDAEGNLIAESKMEQYYKKEMCRDWSEYDLMCGYTPPTPTVIYRADAYRKVCAERNRYSVKIVNGDTVIASIIGKYGKGKFHDDIASSVCRVHSGGVWQMKSDLYKRLSSYKLFTFLQQVHKTNKEVKKYIFNTRFCLVQRIIGLSIVGGHRKTFVHYYFILWGMLLKMFNLKTVYITHKDIAHWIKVRNA